jgi:hypothetical protein
MPDRRREGFEQLLRLLFLKPGGEDIIPPGKQGGDYSLYLLNTLVGSEYDFGKPLPEASVVIDNRIAQIFEWELTKPFNCGVYALLAALYLIKKQFYLFNIHAASSPLPE